MKSQSFSIILKGLSLANLRGAVLPSPLEVLEWFNFFEAGWVHNGDITKPHAKCRSGKCSTGYFLCKKVMKYGNLREILAACLIQELRKAGLDEVDGVFGSPYSSILFAGDVGRLLGVPTYVPEKDPKDATGCNMIFKSDDPIPEGSVLLQVEELVTMFDSGEATKQAVRKGNPNNVIFAPFVGVLVYRPPTIARMLDDGRRIVPFIEKQIDAWEPIDCPLCPQGSIALAPKGENWVKLLA